MLSQLRDPEKMYITKGEATTVHYGQKTLNIKGKARYFLIVLRAYFKINLFYAKALYRKECFYGPFKGEFGHFLLHNLPFLSHLHYKGVKIHYCGMSLHRAFLVDSSGKSIIHKYYPLRDFFSEVPSRANETIPPPDVQVEIDAFVANAKKSGLPFLNIADKDLYWFVFRNWQLKKGRQHVYNIENVYKTRTENSCVIFPRKKGNATTPNNGGPWDYLQVARLVSPYFDKVYITGHPSMSAEILSEGNIEACLSTDNKDVIEKCANARLVISQHSGAVHIGIYTNSDVLLIFKGQPPIKGLIDTIRFRKNLTSKQQSYAFSYDDIVSYVKSISLKN
jgi:ADP-heptose:LPS heptosyltransferase